jgi:hypothetical protein
MFLASLFGEKTDVPSSPQLDEASSSDNRQKKIARRRTPERRSRKSGGLIYRGESKRETIDRRYSLADRRDVST